jgi:hypothetical protein
MPYKIPYNSLPDCGGLEVGDYVPMLRTPFTEGRASVQNFIDIVTPYQIYSAAFNQTGTDDPTVKIFQNTIGAIEWARTSAGNYEGKLIGAFLDKDVPVQFVMLGMGGSGAFHFASIEKVDDDNVLLTTTNVNTVQDNLLTDSFFEFKIYAS